MSACIDRPISWLVLERYGVGEVDDEERTRVAAHLEACEACRACFARIEEDAKRDLPPLRAPSSRAAKRRIGFRIGPRVVALGSALAIAALVVLGVRVGGDGAPSVDGPSRTQATHVKGGDVVLSLVRDGDTPWASEAGTFRSGDRFKALVTCPPSLDASWDLAVVEPGGVALPLDPPPGRVTCGNEVPLPGAFRLTGRGAVDVCLVWNERGSVDRDALALGGARAVDHAPHACQHLEGSP